MRLYETHGKDLDRDSLAVVIRHTCGETDNQELDRTAEIATGEDGKELLKWEKVSGLD